MDASAISLARENEIPMIVFSIEKQGSFGRVLRHEDKFTLITDE
jgi:uridylate kinase